MLLTLAGWLIFGGSGRQTASNPVDVAGGGPANTSSDVGKAPTEKKPSGPRTNTRAVSSKLREIGIAFHNHHDVNKVFAPAVSSDAPQATPKPNQRPAPTLLSWRVHLLPFLDQLPLWEQFHIDEPWDSPHNKTLLDKMPDVYRLDSTERTNTRFQVIRGPNFLFGRASAPRIAECADGTRHTILTVVTGPDKAVPWTKPDDFEFDPDRPVASLGSLPDPWIFCEMVDGRVLILKRSIEPAKFLALATPSGKEIIDADGLRREYEESRFAP
jgi:hypothetical protein